MEVLVLTFVAECCGQLDREHRKRMRIMIRESSSVIGKENSGKPKVFRHCRAVWGKGLDQLCII